MADENRGPDHPLTRAIEKEGHRFSFFQVVRLLQQAFPDRARLGGQGPAARELLRLRPALDLAFAPSDVREVRRASSPEGEPRYEVTVTFMGLYGAVSPLPSYFTEELIRQEEDEEGERQGLARGVLDLFHHRILSLFYRAWEKYRLAAQFEAGGADPLSRKLMALLGVDRLPESHRVAAVRLLGMAGVLTRNPKCAGAVAAMLNDYFEGPEFEVDPCVPRRVPIPPEQENRLGRSNCRLGSDLTLGDRVLDRSGTFRIRISALGLPDFLGFLPGGDRLAELRELVDLVNTDGLDYEIELRLRREEVPELRLSGETARLGWLTWLGGRTEDDPRVNFMMEGWLHGRG